jgi:hypothetical protein
VYIQTPNKCYKEEKSARRKKTTKKYLPGREMKHGHRKRENRERERTQRRRMLATTATVPFSFEGFAEEKAKGTTWGRRTDGRTDGETGPPSRAHNGGQKETGGGQKETGGGQGQGQR